MFSSARLTVLVWLLTYQFLPARNISADWLLAQHVYARLQQLFRDGNVCVVLRAYYSRVNMQAYVSQHVFDGGEAGAVVCRSSHGDVWICVHYACQGCGGHRVEGGDMAGFYSAEADYGDV